MKLAYKIGIIIIGIFLIFALAQYYIFVKYLQIKAPIRQAAENKDILLYEKYINDLTARIDTEAQNLCNVAELNATKFARNLYLNKINAIQKELVIFHNKNSPNFKHTFLFNKHGRLVAGKPFGANQLNEIYSYTHYYQYLLVNTIRSKKAEVYYYMNDPAIMKRARSLVSKSIDASQPPFMSAKDLKDGSEDYHNFFNVKDVFVKPQQAVKTEYKFPLMVIGAPIFYENKSFLGITGFTVNWESFLKKIKEGFLDSITLYIFDKNGFLVEHPDKYHVGEELIDSEIISKVLKGEGEYFLDSNGLYVYSKPKFFDWVVIGQIKVAGAIKKLPAAKATTAPLLILLLFEASLLVLLFLFLQKYVFEPIGLFSSSLSKLKNGNFSAPINLHSKDDFGEMAKNFNAFVTMAKKNENLNTLSLKNVGGNIINRYLSDSSQLALAGDRMEGSVVFLRIKNITYIMEKFSSQEVISALSNLYQAAEEIVSRHNGYFIRACGSSMFIYFGIPFKFENYAREAVDCTKELLSRLSGLKVSGNQKFAVSAGVATGTLYAGQITTDNGKEYVITGSPAILAHQLESLAKQNVALIDDITFKKDKIKIEKMLKLKIRDRSEALTTYILKK